MQCITNSSEDIMFGKIERTEHAVFIFMQYVSDGLQDLLSSHFEQASPVAAIFVKATRDLPIVGRKLELGFGSLL